MDGIESILFYQHCNPFRLNSAKFGICTIVGLNGTLFEAEIRTWDT
jgi:hypothetical protein